jgi:hypothetical protein
VVEAILARWRAVPPAEGDDGWREAILRSWALLEPLGRLAPTAMAGPTSRAWFDELRLAPVLAAALRERGLDEAAAWSAVERIRLLLTLPRPSNAGGRSAAGRALRLAAAWLDTPETRAFLRVNRWEDAEWFDRDAWDELLGWASDLDALDGRPRSGVEAELRTAAEATGYRVDRLGDALALSRAKAEPRTRGRTAAGRGKPGTSGTRAGRPRPGGQTR